MSTTTLYRYIRKTFRVTVRDDFSPIGCHHGDRHTLVDMWARHGYKHGVEIGVHRAEFSEAILTKIPGSRLGCIDPWSVYDGSHFAAKAQEKNYQIATGRLAPYADRVTIIREASWDVAKNFADKSLDFLFIDGDHSFNGCALDLILWCPKVRSGGMVAVHDYCPMRRGGVIEAVDDYTKCNMIAPWFVTREAIPTAFWVVA